jgi:hypothetical protein
MARPLLMMMEAERSFEKGPRVLPNEGKGASASIFGWAPMAKSPIGFPNFGLSLPLSLHAGNGGGEGFFFGAENCC